MSQDRPEYEKLMAAVRESQRQRPFVHVLHWPLRITAMAIVVLSGLKFFIGIMVLVASLASTRGSFEKAFDNCMAAATPLALGGILLVVNEFVVRRTPRTKLVRENDLNHTR